MGSFTFGKTKLGKVAYDIYVISEAGTDFAAWTKVGICAAEPTLKDIKGDTIKTNDGVDNTIARNQEVAFTVYEVTADNRSALLTLINKVTNVAFVVKGGSAPSGLNATSGGWLILNVNLFPETNITGNAQNQIACTGMIEVGASDVTNFTGA